MKIELNEKQIRMIIEGLKKLKAHYETLELNDYLRADLLEIESEINRLTIILEG